LEYLGKSSDQIPELYAYFSENGQFYLVQEWIHGQTLREVVQAKEYESETTVRGILLSLLSVLDYIHSKGIIHRDIKPDNIIIRSVDGKPVLIDFGAVKETIRSVVSSSRYPTQSMVIGTPGYMPSEQALGRPVYATDIYSLGVTAIYLLTGKSPHELQTHQQTGEIIWQDYAPQVSNNLAEILNQAMKPLAGDRYTTASKMLYALQSANYSSPNTATLPPTTVKSTRQTEVLASIPQIPASNWQKPAVVIGSLLVGGLFGAVVIPSMTRQPEPEVPITKNSAPSPQSVATNPESVNTPVSTLPSPTPITPTSRLRRPQVVPPPKINPNPVAIYTPRPEIQPIPTDTPTPPLASTPQPEMENQPTPTPTPTPTPEISPESQNQVLKIATSSSVPAFPTGTARSSIEAILGKPNKDLRGLWPNTRAIIYKVVPNKIDLGYLFDRNSGTLRQTEASFASSVDKQVMQTTLDGMLGGQATAEIQQGLQQVQQRKSDNFKFTKGRVKGQIVRQKCNFIYISIWDADLHDFVNSSDAKQC
jgi:serine/threonine-protein kinase